MQIKVLFACGDIERASNLYYLIHETYKPLLTNGVYKGKVVFLLDQPDASKSALFQAFKDAHPYLLEGEQLHLLPVPALEMYYPNPYKKTKQQVDEMNEIKAKVDLAKVVASSITEDQLRTEMPIISSMLTKSVELAYE